MKQEIKSRITNLREYMKKAKVNAFIIPSTDPHLSEYVAPHWEARKWISGFDGSAGTVVVTETKAGLWTDSRYFLQAEEQLKGTGIDLYKEMLSETPTIKEFLINELEKEEVVGIDSKVFSITETEALMSALEQSNIELKTVKDPFDYIWKDRPSIPTNIPFEYTLEYAGISSQEKIKQIRTFLTKKSAQALFISALDEIAWTLNIRGNDIEFNPLAISYLLITQDKTTWFINPEKIDDKLQQYINNNSIEIVNYKDCESYLSQNKIGTIILEKGKTNFAIYSAISNSHNTILFDSTPVALLKAIRNKTEIEGIHSAMKKDGIALVKFLMWLEKEVPSNQVTELDVVNKLRELRAQQPLFMGESFDTISGYKEHAAIVHYSVSPETNATLHNKGYILIDSGAQYLDGTTDITRTIALGDLSEEEKKDYTLVLKGHINLAMAQFPENTRGTQLDILARLPLWKEQMNFLHGTGHGVGHFLNVHEGPQSIRMNENATTFKEGMVTSNEPGVYKANSHGIRIENLILTCLHEKGEYCNFLKFETITLCPICKKGIVKELLSSEEIDWLNNYHQKVYSILSPSLNNEEKEWLKEATKTL